MPKELPMHCPKCGAGACFRTQDSTTYKCNATVCNASTRVRDAYYPPICLFNAAAARLVREAAENKVTPCTMADDCNCSICEFKRIIIH